MHSLDKLGAIGDKSYPKSKIAMTFFSTLFFVRFYFYGFLAQVAVGGA